MCCIMKFCNCRVLLAVEMSAVACRDWCVCVCVCAVGKMAKDIGMTIRKSIVVSFLPCLVAFLAYHPYIFFHFLKMFFCYFISSIPVNLEIVIFFLLLVSVIFWGGENHGLLRLYSCSL